MRGFRSNEPFRRWRAGLALAVVAGLAAGCGGGGGGGGPDASTSQLGLAKVLVADKFGAPVAGAAVALTAGSGPSYTTGSDGVALVVAPIGAVDVSIAVPSFVPLVAHANVGSGQTAVVPVTLQRVTAPAGGSLATRSGTQPLVSADGRTLSFEVELVVVGEDANPVEGLAATDFQLLPCKPDAATPAAECLRNASTDHAYVASGAATDLQVVPGQPVMAHAVGLLIDQSGSIASTDRQNARLYAAKTLLAGLASGDQVVIGAFSDGAGATLPQQPLTVLGSFADVITAPLYFTQLDALASQSGGATPLYASIDAMRARLVGDAALTPGNPRAMVVFTDGADSYCGVTISCAARRQQVVDAARSSGVRLFTIGLSGDIDVEALSSMATAGGGVMLYADKVEQLIPLYGSLRRLVSLALPTYRIRFVIDAGEGGVFASGRTVLARARVDVRGRTVDIPFAVGIP